MITHAMAISNTALKKALGTLALSLFIAIVFFSCQFVNDNIYSQPQLTTTKVITQDEIAEGKKIFLINGWDTVDGAVTPDQWGSNILSQSQNVSIATHNNATSAWNYSGTSNTATYRLNFTYQGSSQTAILSFEAPYSQQQIWLNGKKVTKDTFGGIQSVFLQQGKNELIIIADHRYLGYDEMLTAPWVSNLHNVQTVIFIQCLFYCAAFLIAVLLGVYTIILWSGNTLAKIYYEFSLFCFSFAVYCSDYFINAVAPVQVLPWKIIHQVAYLSMGWFLFRLSSQIAKLNDRLAYKTCIKPLAAVFFSYYLAAIVLSAFHVGFAKLFIIFELIYKLLLYVWLMFSCYWAVQAQYAESGYLLVGAIFFSSGLWASILHQNDFAPILGGWQVEWCGLSLVLTYGCMMARRNRRILQENEELNDKLLEMVGQRTVQLSKLLEERKKFFSEIVHDLKAPISAVNTFVTLIRKHSVGVDDEMLKYLDMVQQKQEEMARRVQSLNEFNKIDGLASPAKLLSLCELLQAIYDYHNPEAEVLGIRMTLNLPRNDAVVLASEEKLHIVFENLIYNALSFTKPNDSITITAFRQEDTAVIQVTDTGVGISKEALPRIFDRFFVGRENPSEGNGLGLYIARQILLEANGVITVESIVGQGATFTIKLPIISM